jgi:hypothetical protein
MGDGRCCSPAGYELPFWGSSCPLALTHAPNAKLQPSNSANQRTREEASRLTIMRNVPSFGWQKVVNSASKSYLKQGGTGNRPCLNHLEPSFRRKPKVAAELYRKPPGAAEWQPPKARRLRGRPP